MAKATTGGKKKVFRKKERKNIPNGIVFIQATFNNTLISITDLEGNLVAQSSSGARGFRGFAQGHAFAAQQAAFEVAKRLRKPGAPVRGAREGAGRRARIGHRAIHRRHPRHGHPRPDAHPAQRLRPPKRRRV